MNEPVRPVIVFRGRNEFEAQMARDVLQSAGLPVLHVPSLSTGIFGVQQATRVAVPDTVAEEAVTVLREADFAARIEKTAKGLAAFQEAFLDKLPVDRASAPPGGTQLSRVLMVLAVAVLVLVVFVILKSR